MAGMIGQVAAKIKAAKSNNSSTQSSTKSSPSATQRGGIRGMASKTTNAIKSGVKKMSGGVGAVKRMASNVKSKGIFGS